MLAPRFNTRESERARAEPLELSLYSRDAGLANGQAGAVCFPRDASDVAFAVATCKKLGVPFVARGSGTGLAGGATPLDDALVIVTTQMNRVISIDAASRTAWVEPGLLNLDLTRAAQPYGLHYAPDPSSQQACSIGGNVATNAGGPHCLSSGSTTAHVLAVEAVLPNGEVAMLGSTAPDQPGFDLRGIFVGSEGMLGIATKVLVKLVPNPPQIQTMLLDFMSIDEAAATVSAIIAAGIMPAALEMMDSRITAAVEDFVGAGYPRDAAAVLLVEVDGLSGGVDHQASLITEIGRAHGAREVRLARSESERQLLWKGRKSAFGAIARIAPDYYLHDAVVPRSKLVGVLRTIYEIADSHDLTMMNVFHAGDGNLHPLIVFDRRVIGVWERVQAAGTEILERCLAAGGVLSGEHGIGLEKRAMMAQFFSEADLELQARVADALDPHGLANPGKVLPAGFRCGEVGINRTLPEGTWI